MGRTNLRLYRHSIGFEDQKDMPASLAEKAVRGLKREGSMADDAVDKLDSRKRRLVPQGGLVSNSQRAPARCAMRLDGLQLFP